MDTISEYVEEWLYDLSLTKSSHTVNAYRTPLLHFMAFCAEQGKMAVDDLRPADIPGFVRWLEKRGEYNRSTIALYVTALSRFYRFLLLEDVASYSWLDYERLKERLQDYANGWKKPRPRIPDERDLERLWKEAYKFKACPRDRILRLRNIALLEVLRSTGARVSEVAAMRISDLDPDNHMTVVRGKGEKERAVFFTPKAWKAIEDYLYARQVSTADLPLFIRHDNAKSDEIEPLTTDGIRDAIAELCDRAGIKRITPHQFRHLFAVTLLRKTNNLAVVQDMLGHSDPGTTRIYTQFLPEELRRIHEEAMNGA